MTSTRDALLWLLGRPGERRTRVDDGPELPLDPDLGTAEDRRHRPAGATVVGPFAPTRRSRWPRIHWAGVLAVAAGGFLGGLARYGVTLALPSSTGALPWAIFAVNTAGAFLLALLLIIVLELLPPTTYVRPALGTGFCGAFTTFSSVATGADQLAAHGSGVTAAAYLVGSLVAGLAATSSGMILGRSIVAFREKGRE